MKELLLIMPLSYRYYDDIIKALNADGYYVTFIPDFEESFVKRSIRYFSKEIIIKIQNRYILNKVYTLKKKSFTDVFIIRGYGFRKSTIEILRKRFSGAKFYLYQWDPISISKFDDEAFSLFNRVYSFDSADCKEHAEIKYLPLFYKALKNVNYSDNEILYDFSFIGSFHSNRFSILSSLMKEMKEHNYSFYIRGYINKFSFYYGCLLNRPGYRTFPRECISFYPIPRENAQKIFQQSKVVIDINHPFQTGLSIRVIEVLSKGKKLLTTNKYILKEPFYKSNVAGIIENGSLPVSVNDLLNSNETIDISSFEITNWLKTIIN